MTVQLIDPAQSDRVVMTTTTDSAGLYRFNNQNPTLDAFAPNTNYVVRIAANSGPLAGTRIATPNNIPSDDENDSDGVLGGTNNVNVDAPVNSGADGTVNLRVDFGFIRLEVGNYVWEDANGNGAQEAGEQALPNVVVQLRSGATVLHTTATDARGEYYFSTIAPRLNTGLVENAAYTIVIELQSDVDVIDARPQGTVSEALAKARKLLVVLWCNVSACKHYGNNHCCWQFERAQSNHDLHESMLH